MNNTTHFNLKKPEYTDFADIQDINDNMDTIDGQLAAPTGDVRDATVSFSDSDLDSNINSFSDFLNKIVSGMKLAKFIRDFKAGMAYVLHKGSLINNGTTSVTGTYALDAAYGKTLKDYYDSLNSSLPRMKFFEVRLTTGNTADHITGLYETPAYYLTAFPDYPSGSEVKVIAYGARTSYDARRAANVTYRDADKLIKATYINPNEELIISCLALYLI